MNKRIKKKIEKRNGYKSYCKYRYRVTLRELIRFMLDQGLDMRYSAYSIRKSKRGKAIRLINIFSQDYVYLILAKDIKDFKIISYKRKSIDELCEGDKVIVEDIIKQVKLHWNGK